MPIDRIFLRPENGGDLQLLLNNEIKRGGKNTELINCLVKEDKEWRILSFNIDKARGKIGSINKDIAKKIKAKEDISELLLQKAENEKNLLEMENEKKRMEEQIEKKIRLIGNFVHESVPVSNSEDNNIIVKKWGDVSAKDTHKYSHYELIKMIDGCNFEKGSLLMGHRGYFLKGKIVLLNQALINYGIAFLIKHGYNPVQPPFFMRRDIMSQTAQLEDFNESLYKISSKTEKEEDDDLFLIATSEQPISAMHHKETINVSKLPIKYAGISTCFRKESGKNGVDVRGILRVHQFEKVEQFVITTPENSWSELEKMIDISEQFYQSLGLPYQVINIVSGGLNNAAAKKYDLEAWFPMEGKYRELVSASNCTDYQSRAMHIKYQHGEKKEFVHMLNATLCATERTMCCILENYQTEKGVVIPEVLQQYMMGMEFIPFA